jgi:hypothetical protein
MEYDEIDDVIRALQEGKHLSFCKVDLLRKAQY